MAWVLPNNMTAVALCHVSMKNGNSSEAVEEHTLRI
jgi:hypothetical protein